ncbi:MAG: filamentous hemagglutinin N-terminal domain-containing protein, partial [Alphaproteobacteria bacterium]|nr:filamentous hemagglutinin N-terminal domain-containing protein [Alphaproteobacteria bacterium]
MTGAVESQRSALARRGRRLSLRAVLFAGVSTVALTSAAFANPQGGEVVAGSATVTTPTSTTTQINQQSDKAIINWKSFNVDAGESTVFVQPNATSITLNRIFDSNPSVIAGLISANGQIILINRNGMMFQAGSRVDTAGLIASTADISNENFLSNKFQFDIAGTVGASITNEGAITAQPGGLVAIVAPTVENRGIITAKFGRVGLGAGSTFTLDLQGENLVSFPISEELAQQLTGGDFKGAEGKFVVLSSEAAR